MKWKKVKLSELCEINIGKTPSRSISEYWGIGYSWVSISDMKEKIGGTPHNICYCLGQII